jgi:hypothetical protein
VRTQAFGLCSTPVIARISGPAQGATLAVDPKTGNLHLTIPLVATTKPKRSRAMHKAVESEVADPQCGAPGDFALRGRRPKLQLEYTHLLTATGPTSPQK